MKVGIEVMYFNIIKVVYDKPIANILPNGENMNASLLKSERRPGCLLSWHLFNIVLEFLATAIRQGKKKCIEIGREEVKLSLYTVDMIIYRNP